MFSYKARYNALTVHQSIHSFRIPNLRPWSSNSTQQTTWKQQAYTEDKEAVLTWSDIYT